MAVERGVGPALERVVLVGYEADADRGGCRRRLLDRVLDAAPVKTTQREFSDGREDYWGAKRKERKTDRQTDRKKERQKGDKQIKYA